MMDQRGQEALDRRVIIKLNDAMMEEDDWEPAYFDEGANWSDQGTSHPTSHVAPSIASTTPGCGRNSASDLFSDHFSSSSVMSSDTLTLSRSFSLPFLDVLDAEDQEGSSDVKWAEARSHEHLESDSSGTLTRSHDENQEWQVQCDMETQCRAQLQHHLQPVTLAMPMPPSPLLKSLSTPQLLSGSHCQSMLAQQLTAITTGNQHEPLPDAAVNNVPDCTDGSLAGMRQRAVPVIPLRRSEVQNTQMTGSIGDVTSTSAAEDSIETSHGTMVAPPSQSMTQSFIVERRKEKKNRTLRHGSAIFLFGASRCKKSKEDIRRCRESHHFVPVSISTSALCWSCRKALAHKLTVKCQRCNLICHEVCLDQIEVCSATLLAPSSSSSSSFFNNRSVPNPVTDNNGNAAPTSLSNDMGQRRRLNSTGNELASEELQSPINGRNSPSLTLEPQQMASDPSLEGTRLLPTLPAQSAKRLSVPVSFANSKLTGLGAAQSESSLSPSSPSGGGSSSLLRRPISPSGFSRWRHVADKLLNKSGSTESQGVDYDSAADDISLSEPTSHVGQVLGRGSDSSAAVKADSVIHLLPMLRFDADLRLDLDEPEAWVSLVDASVLRDMPEEEVKRQSMIHELIFLEKNYQIILLIIDQLYIVGLQRDLQWTEADVRLFFPSFKDIVSVHRTFLGRLRARQGQGVVITQIGDVFLQQFEGDEAEKMKKAYSDFCCHKKQAEAEYKQRLKSDAKFAAFDKKWNENIGNRNLRFDSVMQTITQRITKYRILVDNICKKTNKNSVDYGLMSRACHHVDDVISHVNRELDHQKLKEELGRIYRSFDSKSTLVGRDGTPYAPQEEWKKHHLLDTERSLLFEPRPVQVQRSSKDEEKKAVGVTLLVMSDVLVLLSSSGTRDKYSWANIDQKRDRAVIHLQDLVLRLKPEMAAAEERTLYLISQELKSPYEITCETAKERDKLRKEIEAARDHGGNLRPLSALDGDDLADALFLENYAAHMKRLDDVMAACRLKDEGIGRLCHDKGDLLQEMARCAGIAQYRIHRPPLLEVNEHNLPGTAIAMQESAKQAMLQADKLSWLLTGSGLAEHMAVGKEADLTEDKDESQLGVSCAAEAGLEGPPTSPQPSSSLDAARGNVQLPSRRHDTFGGFDNKADIQALNTAAYRSISMKNPERQRRTASQVNGSLSLVSQSERTSNSESMSLVPDDSCLSVSRTSLSPSTLSSRESGDASSSATSSPRLSTVLSDEQASLPPPLLQIGHYLNQLTHGLAQHTTIVEGLREKYTATQQKLTVLEGRDKRLNKHRGQLEELRALQETLAKDKSQWQAERDAEQEKLDRLRKQLDAEMVKAKREREDVEKQRQAMFAQCEKLVENGLEVKLSSSAPYAQIFHRQQQVSPDKSSMPTSDLPSQLTRETSLVLDKERRLAQLPPRPPSHHPSPSSDEAALQQRLMSPPPSGPPRPALIERPAALLSTNSLSSLPVPPPRDAVTTTPQRVAVRQPSQSSLLLPTGPAVSNKHSFSWKGSMESLCDKLRNPREGLGLTPSDRVDSSAALPRPTLRANSEAKLGIGNLMHLSANDHHPPPARKKTSDKKRHVF